MPVLLLPGSGRRQWFDPMTLLRVDDFRMVRPDMPGLGQVERDY